MTIDKLIDDYKACCVIHGEATLEGNSKKANTSYKNIIKILNKIIDIDGGVDSLAELMRDENISVKTWSASHLLGYSEYTEKAAKVLEDIANGNDILSFNAKMVLETKT